MIRLSHISSTSIFLPLLTLLPPHWPSYFLEHAKDFPSSGPLYLLFPQLRMYCPLIFLVLCFLFSYGLYGTVSSQRHFLTDVSQIRPGIILSPCLFSSSQHLSLPYMTLFFYIYFLLACNSHRRKTLFFPFPSPK